MSDIKVSLIAEKLGKDLEAAADRVTIEIQDAIKDLASAAYANIIAHVQSSSMGSDSKKDYLKALQFMPIGNDSYIIYLDGDWPTKLEEGFGSYSIKDALLASNKKVQTGPRAGEPWVRTSKEGKKYAAVPFGQKPSAPSGGNLANDIKKLYAMNRQGKPQKITKTFTDDLGKPITGKVATASGTDIPANLQGLTKYQSVSDKGTVSSIYRTYRMVSEDSPGWISPGSSGQGIFDKVEKEVEMEIENILKTLVT